MMLIGVRWISWGKQPYRRGPSYCPSCGQGSRFRIRTRMRFFHILWIPLIPVSGKHEVYECSHCRAAYDLAG